MPRPAVATPVDVRSAVLALLTHSGLGERPSPQSFRRAVSVRKVRERLGGGNPATISHEINAVEAEIVQAGLTNVALPDIPADIAELMQQLWRAAVAAQLDEVAALKTAALAEAQAAGDRLAEGALRVEVLKQELTELRALLAQRDQELAQARADRAAGSQGQQAQLEQLAATQAHAQGLAGELQSVNETRSREVAAAQERYDGLSRRLLEETAQQRQAAQAEVSRMATQLKFADKREAALQARLQQVEADLAEARAMANKAEGTAQKAEGETAALRYVNASLRTQLDDLARSRPAAPPTKSAAAAQGRERRSPAKPSSTPTDKPPARASKKTRHDGRPPSVP